MAKDAENYTGQDQTEEVENTNYDAPTLERELDTSVEEQNKEETAKLIEQKDEPTDDPGQLTEDMQGDYQRRVSMGVNPSELSYDDDDNISDDEPEVEKIDEVKE